MIAIALKLCLLVLSPVHCEPLTPAIIPPTAGFLSAYDQLPTDATIQYRQENGQIPLDLSSYDGLIAVYDCGMIGTTVTLQTISGDLSVMVFDCANDADGGQAWMLEHEYVAELDHYTWQSRPELLGTWAELED